MRTFIDSGVLILAWRGNPQQKIKALTFISEPHREFISSVFVELEVFPKPNWYKNAQEVSFYQRFFDKVLYGADGYDYLVTDALDIGKQYGLGGMDALHIAAAIECGADEFITSERPTSPLFRVQGLTVRTIA